MPPISAHLDASVGGCRHPQFMGVSGSGEAIGRILSRPPQSHPYAHGSFGFWVVQQKPARPLGWVLARSEHGVYVMDCYAYCRDEGGKRPWLKTFASLNSAVAWMLQHEEEIHDLINRNQPEPN